MTVLPRPGRSRRGASAVRLLLLAALGVGAVSAPARGQTAVALPTPSPPGSSLPVSPGAAGVSGVAPPSGLPGERPLPGGFGSIRRRGSVSGPAPPGLPPATGRPRPGSLFDPGAAGPGISQRGDENFLDGALDSRTGWPFVFLDHFQPRPGQVARFWVVQTRDVPQEMGTEPWPKLKVFHFDEHGDLEERPPSELFAQAAGRPVLVQVQGSLTTPDIALGGLLWTHSWLRRNKALDEEAVVIAFDWPSQRVYRNDARDIDEKGRRAFVAAYHLARFVQAFPPGSRVCLLGQSYGGRVVPSALHLLGGGALNSMSGDPPVCLPQSRRDLHLRAVIIAGASDHQWLNPGQKLDHALYACEGMLNLYNLRDEALRLYPFLRRSDHRRALGKIGLSNKDFEALGPLAARYAEHNVDEVLGAEHSLLDAVANPHVGNLIAPYTWNHKAGPAPPQGEREGAGLEDRKGNNNRLLKPGRGGR